MVVEDWYAFPTNYSNGTTADSPGKLLLQYPSLILNDWLAWGVLGIIWLFTFIVSMSSGSNKALLASSFITFMFSILFLRLNLINPIICLILIGMTILGAIFSSKETGI